MGLTDRLDSWHRRTVANAWLQLFTINVRVLLAAAFIPSGLTKLLGNRFTVLPPTTPVGYLFDALYQAHGYYQFIGAMQVLAGLLLLFGSTATLGAVLYFPIILNIFLITVSVDFGNTRFIAGGMLLASTYLLCWNYDRLRQILPGSPAAMTNASGTAAGVLTTLPLLFSAGCGLLGILGLHRAWLGRGGIAVPILLLSAGVAGALLIAKRTLRLSTNDPAQ